jgi:Na+/H+ antiporter NhaD/arsenite permease-like protein
MTEIIICIFVLGYLCIALEHPIKIDKAGSALVTGVLCWVVIVMFSGEDSHIAIKNLEHTILPEIAEILFFLLGAMTIVELVDAHEGFSVITNKIKTINRIKLLWILSFLTFFFSAILDNLTTAIIMAALLPKIIKDKDDIWFFAGMLIIAANAGGAWSPMGDVTTIMLWIDGQVSLNIIPAIFIPSLVCMLTPLIYLSFTLTGDISKPIINKEIEHKLNPTSSFERNFIFIAGVLGLLFVPIFKLVTHLPPYMGMLLSLGVLWIASEILHRTKNSEQKSSFTVVGVLQKIDMPTIFFFLGILLAVGALDESGILKTLSVFLNDSEAINGNIYVINIIIGLLSAIVDNVPLVAGAMNMYSIDVSGDFAQDGLFWQLLAYCAGTGGSLLIIGSAAGVAVMGILKIDFMWYLKKISFLALIGYASGAATYILLQII